MTDRYHHGNLREQVLAAAADQIAREGADALSMRGLAREAGVTHGAPAHHFGDRCGLFTALAAEGFAGLADALRPSVAARDFMAAAVAYVGFAVGHPGHYAVMFRADLVDPDDVALRREQDRAGAALTDGLATVPSATLLVPTAEARRAAWALVHGIASLHLAGVLSESDPAELARAAARQMFGREG